MQNGSYDEYLAALTAQMPKPAPAQTPTGAAMGMRQQLFPGAPAPVPPAPGPRAAFGIDPTPTGTVAAGVGQGLGDLDVMRGAAPARPAGQSWPVAPGQVTSLPTFSGGLLFGGNDSAPADPAAVPMPAGAADILATLPQPAPAATPLPSAAPASGRSVSTGDAGTPLSASPAVPHGSPIVVGDPTAHSLDQAVAMNQHLTPRAIQFLMQMAPPVLAPHDKIVSQLDQSYTQNHNDAVENARQLFEAATSPVDANGKARTVSPEAAKAAQQTFMASRQKAMEDWMKNRAGLVQGAYANVNALGMMGQQPTR